MDADLAGASFEALAFDRCVFRGCSFVGTHFTDSVLRNVIFENCRLDYASFVNIRAAAPVAFVSCSLTEVAFDRCKFPSVVFDECRLDATSLDSCDLRGADLRNNNLSRIVGIASFRGVILSEEQLPGLAESLVREMQLNIRAR